MSASGDTAGIALADSTGEDVPREPKQRAASAIASLRRRAAGTDSVKAAERRVRQAEKRARRSQRRETRRFTASARRTRRRVLIGVSSVLALVLFVFVGTFTPIMAVRDIQIEGAETVSVADVSAALQEFEGTPIALVDETEVLHALSNFPIIQRFAIERIPPHTLLVRIEERVPVIALEDDGVIRLYDAAGVLLGQPEERPEGVPLGGNGVRNTASDAFGEASKVVRDMPAELRASIAEVNASTGQDVTFALVNGIEVFWGNSDETKRKSLILQTMLASLEGRAVEHIDVSSVESPIFK